jgi:hypothetical protein
MQITWRNNESDQIFHFLKSRHIQDRILIIIGVAGSGKTSLIKATIEKNKAHPVLYNYKFSPDIDSINFIIYLLKKLISKIALDKKSDNKFILKYFISFFNLSDENQIYLESIINYIYDEPIENKHFILSQLVNLISEIIENYRSDIVLYWDDIHWASSSFDFLLERIGKIKNKYNYKIKIICSSRKSPILSKELSPIFINLNSFNKNSIKDLFIQELKISLEDDSIIRIHKMTRGNLFLISEIISHLMELKTKKAIENRILKLEKSVDNKFIYKYILQNFYLLSKEERDFIETISCANSPLITSDIKKLFKYDTKKIIHACRQQGLLSENLDEISLSHDIYRETIFNSLSSDRKVEIHRKFIKIMKSKIYLKPINDLIKLLNHSYACGDSALSFTVALYLVEKSTNFFMPDIAQNALSYLLDGIKKYKKRQLRMLKIGILGGKAFLLQGSIEQAKKYILLIHENIEHPKIPRKIYIDGLNVLSFYYWTAGQLNTAKDLLEKLLSMKELSENQRALFSFRIAGIISDNGFFKLSNEYIEKYLEERTISKSHINILGSTYQILPAILAIKARNLSYLGQKEDFSSLSESILSSLKNDFSLSDILARCLIADGYISIQDYDRALTISSDAARVAAKNNLTTLNPFIFTIIGFSKCMLEDKAGLHLIYKSIKAAELDKRYSRLGLYYLYYIKASKKIYPHLTHTRYKKRALLLARNNDEQWIEKQLLSL